MTKETPREQRAREALMAAACEAEELFGVDECERFARELHHCRKCGEALDTHNEGQRCPDDGNLHRE